MEAQLSELTEKLAAALRLVDERLSAEPVTEEAVAAAAERYESSPGPIDDLAWGNFHPSDPAEVAWALSLLAQEVLSPQTQSSLWRRVERIEAALHGASGGFSVVGPVAE